MQPTQPTQPTQPSQPYPALLSQVAFSFKTLITLSTHTKDSIQYKDCFQGRQAIDLISTLIKTKDRNVCILVGRALGGQGLFNDVVWVSALRDSVAEFYKFGSNCYVVAVRDEAASNQSRRDWLRA
jgi:RHO1 GDP-GTP exchange protein 1/2